MRLDLELLGTIRAAQFRLLWENLRNVSDEELAWQPHPQANSIRWILGHLVWFEEWVPDALLGAGRYLTDDGPLSHDLRDISEIRTRFDAARGRLERAAGALSDSDLEREVSFFGAYDVSILDVLRTHATHLAGHRYQVRYIRGAFSRATGTRKAEFDRW